MVDEVGAEELAIDANKVGPVEPRREAVVVATVVEAVDVTTNRKSGDLVQAEPFGVSHISEQHDEWDTNLPNYNIFCMGTREFKNIFEFKIIFPVFCFNSLFQCTL